MSFPRTDCVPETQQLGLPETTHSKRAGNQQGDFGKHVITEQRKPEWLDLKSAHRYASVSARTLRAWIQRSVEPLPVVRLGEKTMVRRRTFDQWLETYQPVVAGLSSFLRNESSRPSPWFPNHTVGSVICGREVDAMDWLANSNFASPAVAWDSCVRGDWMMWLLEHTNPLTDEQVDELGRALDPFLVKRHAAQSPAETKQAAAEFELAKANALRKMVGNPWRSQNGTT
jgi:hypothetical protein